MIDLKRCKKITNPPNAVITGVIVLFIFIRVISTNHENAFIIEEISSNELQIEIQTEIQTETQTIENRAQNASTTNTTHSEPLAYSAELGKTFTIDAFNKLTKEELMTFSGIGEVTAQAILDYIQDHGPFSRFEDLMLVKGIGEKKLQKITTILP